MNTPPYERGEADGSSLQQLPSTLSPFFFGQLNTISVMFDLTEVCLCVRRFDRTGHLTIGVLEFAKHELKAPDDGKQKPESTVDQEVKGLSQGAGTIAF